MADLQKVIKGLECCRKGFCFACPYNDGVDDNVDCKQIWADDALELLKEQEPVIQGVWYMGPDNMWTCSECGQTWEVGDGWRWRFRYCPHCGAHMWEGEKDGTVD